jgi:hypothetical protein
LTLDKGILLRLERGIRARFALAGLVAAVIALTGCTGATKSASESETTASPSAGDVPAFEGPYAAQFADYYGRAPSDFVRNVLKDGQITDAEYAEMTSDFTSCLADQGITFDGFNADGSFSTSLAPNEADTHDIVTQCSSSSGADSIGALYSFIKTNPDNLDWATITKDCLIRKGVVPPDYSAEEFAQDNTGRFADIGNLPEDLQKALVSCSSDPLGLLD